MKWVVLPLLLCACVTSSAGIIQPNIATRDAPDEGRIYLSLRNDGPTAICLYPTDWPTTGGVVDTASTRVSVEIDGVRFPMKDLDAGYCPGCQTRVQPAETVSAFVRYADFGLPAEVEKRPKRLVFQPNAHKCR